MISLTEAKQQATILKKFLKQSNQNITQSSCLQAVAKMQGYPDWNTMAAQASPKGSTQSKNLLWGSPIHITDAAFQYIGDKRDLDVYNLFKAIILLLKENTLVIKMFPHGFWARLGERWDENRFNTALNKLAQVKLIHYSHDTNGKAVISINPLHCWKGDLKFHEIAIEAFHLAVAVSSQEINFHDLSFIDSYIRPRFQSRDFESQQIKITEFLAFFEDVQPIDACATKKISLKTLDNNNISEHPQIIELNKFLGEIGLFHPVHCLMHTKLFTEDDYKLSFDDNTVLIKSKDQLTKIAHINFGLKLQS